MPYCCWGDTWTKPSDCSTSKSKTQPDFGGSWMHDSTTKRPCSYLKPSDWINLRVLDFPDFVSFNSELHRITAQLRLYGHTISEAEMIEKLCQPFPLPHLYCYNNIEIWISELTHNWCPIFCLQKSISSCYSKMQSHGRLERCMPPNQSWGRPKPHQPLRQKHMPPKHRNGRPKASPRSSHPNIQGTWQGGRPRSRNSLTPNTLRVTAINVAVKATMLRNAELRHML